MIETCTRLWVNFVPDSIVGNVAKSIHSISTNGCIYNIGNVARDPDEGRTTHLEPRLRQQWRPVFLARRDYRRSYCGASTADRILRTRRRSIVTCVTCRKATAGTRSELRMTVDWDQSVRRGPTLNRARISIKPNWIVSLPRLAEARSENMSY